MVYDSIRALDWLVTRGDVEPSRVATLGMSMGSTMAQWLAALDERVKVTVDICCLTEYHTLLAEKGLAGHGIYYYVPGLLKEFTASDVNALVVPRAHLGLAGTKDALTPVAGLDIIDRELKAAYAEAGHPERWKLLRYDVAHQETAEGRREALAFLRANL
jgi:dienelactone hydrolase